MSKYKLSYIFSMLSFIIVIILIILMLDISVKFLPFIRIPTGVYFWPIFICPIAVILSVISLMIKKSKIGYISLILNLILILLEVIFMIVGFRMLIH